MSGILKGRGENKEDMDEVLDALHEEDKLKPIINLVLYYGKEPWNGATSLKRCFLMSLKRSGGFS